MPKTPVPVTTEADQGNMAVAEESLPLRVAVIDAPMPGDGVIRSMAERYGWRLHSFGEIAGALDVVAEHQVDLVVVDVGGVSGTETDLADLADIVDVPVITLVEGSDAAKVALRLGATLAVGKPFDPEVLLLSIRALLRSKPLPPVLSHVIALDDLMVHVADHAVVRRGRRQVLSATEWQFLALLMTQPGRIFSRDEMVRGVWGTELPGRHAAVDLYVFRLRKKVERNPRQPLIVETVRNLGYRLATKAVSLRSGQVRAAAEVTAGADWLSSVPGADARGWAEMYTELAETLSDAADRARALTARSAPEARRALTDADVIHLDAETRRCRERAAFWSREVHASEGMRAAAAQHLRLDVVGRSRRSAAPAS
jgi:two-component system response regulator MtrA